MLVKPPLQSKPTNPLLNENVIKEAENGSILKNNDHEGIKNYKTEQKEIIPNSDNSIIKTQETKEAIIYKKRQFNQFLKLIKEKKFTTAVLSAKLIGVSRDTITEWMKIKVVRELMNNTYNNYIQDIEQAKDWKAKAYLIDKIEGINNKQEQVQDLKQLIVINT